MVCEQQALPCQLSNIGSAHRSVVLTHILPLVLGKMQIEDNLNRWEKTFSWRFKAIKLISWKLLIRKHNSTSQVAALWCCTNGQPLHSIIINCAIERDALINISLEPTGTLFLIAKCQRPLYIGWVTWIQAHQCYKEHQLFNPRALDLELWCHAVDISRLEQ